LQEKPFCEDFKHSGCDRLILYIFIAVLVFGLLVFVHELGHFLAARASGVQVNEFSIGMGPAVFQKTKGDTVYSLRCIPIGGFCAMEGEDENSGNPKAFTSAKTWKRFVILAAGSAMNFLAGILALLVVYSTAAGFAVPVISGFFENSDISQQTGLAVGDELHSIDGKRVFIYSDVSMLLARNSTGVFDLEVIREGEKISLQDVPMAPKEYEVDGVKSLKYGLYFSFAENSLSAVLKNTWYTAVDFARLVWLGLSDLVTGIVGLDDMSGPVGIVSVMAQTGQASKTAADAAVNLAYFSAFLAVNLAVMNMLPIPALDGGRVFFLLVTWVAEKMTGKKIDPKYEGYIHAAGMILLLGFIAFITLKDILKLFG